ncbi:MAG: hydrogenase maturation protease [Candidatus Helarchaeota archaeon]
MGVIDANRKQIEEYLVKYMDGNSRIALIGIGNEDRHDDFVGSYILRKLMAKKFQRKNIYLIDAGTGPTNYIAELAEWNPELVIMIDAVDAQEPPGTLLLVEKDALHSQSVDSHSNAKVLLLDFLLGINPSLKTVIIGIQVKDISLTRQLSPEIIETAEWLIQRLENYLNSP